MNLASVPSILAPNLIAHFYPGSGAIARFRGLEAGAVVSPEDWVGSATKRYGHDLSGLSRLEDGGFLADAIVKDPVAFLGPDHVEAFGVDTGLLVKLLDPGERLIVHSHPDRTFANRHLGCAHGKTEAWIVLSESPGEVFLGFDRQVAEEELAGWVASQSIDEMLGSLNTLSVSRGDAVLVPAGIPHAIGAGVFAVELQEPTDFSFALEHRNFTDPDLRLGWDLALSSVDRSAWPADRLARLAGPGLKTAGRVLPAQADPFFRADLVVSPEGRDGWDGLRGSRRAGRLWRDHLRIGPAAPGELWCDCAAPLRGGSGPANRRCRRHSVPATCSRRAQPGPSGGLIFRVAPAPARPASDHSPGVVSESSSPARRAPTWRGP